MDSIVGKFLFIHAVNPVAGWIDVLWDATGISNSYRMGAEGKMDLALASNQNADAARAALNALAGRPPHLPLTRVLRDLVRSPKPGRGRGTSLTSRKSMSTTNLFDVQKSLLDFNDVYVSRLLVTKIFFL